MKIKKAEVQLDVQGFNDMPGKEKVQMLLTGVFPGLWTAVDVEGKDYWVNACDTLVVTVDHEEVAKLGGKFAVETAIAMAQFVAMAHADEIDSTTVDGRMVIRFWWD